MSVRSRLDLVYFSDTYGSQVAVDHSTAAFFFTPKKCGTIPRLAVIGRILTVEGATAGMEVGASGFESIEPGTEVTGTIPNTATVGAVITAATAVVKNAAGNGRVILAKCGTSKCGN